MQDKFAASVDGMGLQTLEAGETELDRLRKLKLEKMGELVLTSRARIQGAVRCSVCLGTALQPHLSISAVLALCLFVSYLGNFRTSCDAAKYTLTKTSGEWPQPVGCSP